MTDFVPLLAPDRGQKARPIHLVDKHSFEKWMKSRPAEDRALATGYAEGFNAADAARLSARWLRESEASLGEAGGVPARLRDGYDRLTEWLLSGLTAGPTEVRLNTVAAAVRWQPGRVEVDANSAGGAETHAAAAAVVTLPLGVLRAPAGGPGAVAFDPDPPGKRAAWSALPMGPVVKVVLTKL